jgi:hypothetical protein
MEKSDVPSPTSGVTKKTQKSKLLLVLLIVSVILVPLSVVPLVSGLSFGIVNHYACVPMNAVVAQAFWTPVLIVNSPYGGNATGTTYVPASWLPKGTEQSWSTIALNGSSEGLFMLLNWTLHNAQTLIVAGPGFNLKCGGSYLALLQPNPTMDSMSVGLSGNLTSTDGRIPPYSSLFSTMGYPFAEFQDQFSNSTVSSTFNSCSDGGFGGSSNSSNIPVEIPFNVGGKIVSVNSSVEWSQHYVYWFASGNWLADNLTQSHSGTGLAFSSLPCGRA